MSDYKKQIQRIKEILKEMEGNASFEEIMLEIQQIIPPKVIEIERQFKNSEKNLQYMRDWRKQKKKYDALLLKVNNKEAINQQKINKGLKRESFFCFQCKEAVNVDSSLNKYSIESKRGQSKRKIIISNECPNCNTKLRAFGGILA